MNGDQEEDARKLGNHRGQLQHRSSSYDDEAKSSLLDEDDDEVDRLLAKQPIEKTNMGGSSVA